MDIQVGSVSAKARPTRIVFCLPGNNFSGRFLDCWSNLLVSLPKYNIQPILSRSESCNIYYVRNMCLGADVSRGPNQKPFNGEIDYDYLMWIDSDIIFEASQLLSLLGRRENIVAGVYAMQGGQQLAVVKDWDEKFFESFGCFQFLTQKDIEGKRTYSKYVM